VVSATESHSAGCTRIPFAVVPGGRPTKLTPELSEQVCKSLRAGNTVKDSIIAVGVDESTFYRWIQNGYERPNSRYGRFCQSVERATAEAIVVDMRTINRAITEPGRTMTVRTKSVLQAGDWVDVERVTTITELPPDSQAARWRIERRDTRRAGTSTPLDPVPREIMGRTLAEKLRLLQGGDPNDRRASLLRPGDVEARRLLNDR